MADDEEQLRSDNDGETIDAEMQEQVKASRYNLRSRQTVREQEISHQASPLFHLVNRGELENESAALMANLRRTLAATETMLTASSASVTTAPGGLARRGLADENRAGGMRTQSLHGDDSPFEIVAAHGARGRQLPRVPVYDGPIARSDPGSRRALPRVRLPFEFTREEIPYVPPRTQTVEAQASALAFATRMTAIEQMHRRQDGNRTKMPAATEGLPWLEYHRLFGQRLAEGERAMDALSRPAVDSSNEVVIQLHPRPSLDEGHTSYAGRLGPAGLLNASILYRLVDFDHMHFLSLFSTELRRETKREYLKS